jgi:hypothetical protein
MPYKCCTVHEVIIAIIQCNIALVFNSESASVFVSIIVELLAQRLYTCRKTYSALQLHRDELIRYATRFNVTLLVHKCQLTCTVEIGFTVYTIRAQYGTDDFQVNFLLL